MTPDERPMEAARLNKLISEEVRELGEAIRDQPETNWQKAIAKNPWALIAVVLLAVGMMSGLMGRLTDTDAREHAEFRKGLEDMRKWLTNVDSRQQSIDQRLSSYGDDSRRALRMMEDMQREQLEYYRTEAVIRGDSRAARRIDRKLAQLPPPSDSGQ